MPRDESVEDATDIDIDEDPQHLNDKVAEKSTIHGLGDLLEARNKHSRNFWIVVLIFCLAILGYNIVKTAIAFHEAPVGTNVRWKHVKDFPPILYCPGGVLGSKERFDKYGLDVDDLAFLNDFFLASHTRQTRPSMEQKSIEKHRKLLAERNITVAELISDLALSVNFTFYDVKRGKFVAPDVFQTTFAHPGICYRMTVKREASQGHFPNVLAISLPSFRKNFLAESKRLQKLYIFGSLFFGDEGLSFDPQMPVSIKDGYETVVEIKETNTFFIDSKKEPCESVRAYQMSNDVYSCLQERMRNENGCNFLNATNFELDFGQLCNYQINSNLNIVESLEECTVTHIGAKIPCTQTQYESYITELESDDNMTHIYFRYRFTNYMRVEEWEMYTWQTFMSNIGGLLSLLCGASIISIVQLLYFCATEACRHKKAIQLSISRRRNKDAAERKGEKGGNFV